MWENRKNNQNCKTGFLAEKYCENVETNIANICLTLAP